jgi:drug/metabolite transporter (DMT)-like permease
VISRRQIWGLVALTLMWGINWPMMKYSLRELSPLYFRALTMSFGALWLFSYYRLKGVRMWPQAAEWRGVMTLGLPNMLGWHTLSILGVKELASGRAAILGFTMPIWTVLLGVLMFKEKLTLRLVFAMVAVALTIGLLTFNELTALSGKPLGIVWMELAALCWAAGTLMMRRAHLTLPMETLTVWMLVLASVCLWGFATVLEPWPSWQFSAPIWGSLAYGALINYGFAQVIWFGMARHLPPATSAMSVMAVPMVGTLSATLIVNEMPGWQDLVAVLCVMVAIAAVLLPPRQPAKVP